MGMEYLASSLPSSSGLNLGKWRRLLSQQSQMTTSMQCQWRNTLRGANCSQLVSVQSRAKKRFDLLSLFFTKKIQSFLFLFGFHFLSSFFSHSLLFKRFFVVAFGIARTIAERFVAGDIVDTLLGIGFGAPLFTTITEFFVVKFAFTRQVSETSEKKNSKLYFIAQMTFKNDEPKSSKKC